MYVKSKSNLAKPILVQIEHQTLHWLVWSLVLILLVMFLLRALITFKIGVSSSGLIPSLLFVFRPANPTFFFGPMNFCFHVYIGSAASTSGLIVLGTLASVGLILVAACVLCDVNYAHVG
jgi:hypothetical protein